MTVAWGRRCCSSASTASGWPAWTARSPTCTSSSPSSAAPCGDEAGYEPIPVAKWWQLTAEDRANAVGRLRSWVATIYQPLYGHLADQLGGCWPQHPLALMTFDWLSELWNVLYLNPDRTARDLTSQAELGVRILPAAAALLAAETQDCREHGGGGHPAPRTAGRV